MKQITTRMQNEAVRLEELFNKKYPNSKIFEIESLVTDLLSLGQKDPNSRCEAIPMKVNCYIGLESIGLKPVGSSLQKSHTANVNI